MLPIVVIHKLCITTLCYYYYYYYNGSNYYDNTTIITLWQIMTIGINHIYYNSNKVFIHFEYINNKVILQYGAVPASFTSVLNDYLLLQTIIK